MIVKEVVKELEELSPVEYACDWDNVGLLVGDENAEVTKVLVVVDVTDKLIDYALNNNVNMIVSHHPVIFSAIKSMNNNDFLVRKLIKLIKNDIAVYSMHTNFDIKGSMGKIAGEKLWLDKMEVLIPEKDEYGLGVIGQLSYLNLRSLSFIVKDTFELENIKVYGNLNELVSQIAILPGAGRCAIKIAKQKGADVLITGDISHHDGLDAKEMGLKVIDAGHYGIEKIFIDFVANYISEKIDIEVIKEDKKESFVWL